MNVITTKNCVLHYQLTGPEDAPVMVFANSLGTDLRVWSKLIEVMPSKWQYLTYDKRGHGLSSAPDAPYTMQDHVDDLLALIEFLKIDQFVMVGLSVGGMIAQCVAAGLQDRVRALVLMDTADQIGPASNWDDRIALVSEKGIEGISDAILERWFARKFHEQHQAELQLWRHMLERTPVQGYIGTSYAIRNADLSGQLERITQPTLCICGEEDGSTPVEVVRSLSDRLPNSRFEVVKNAGHVPCIEQPLLVAELIGEFLQFNKVE